MVKAWHQQVVIPTYEPGKPEKNPIFLEKRVYQGSSGVVYPYPVIESVADTSHDKTYNAIYLENEYLKVMVLPELGGRIQMAYDKIKNRHFVYYNHVIKPALVGLTGPWISGGIEFNWPQHHRPSTFLPVDSEIERNPDGSVTVWVSEREKMFHQKGMAAFTLYPGCAYLEIKGTLYNPTELPQTFLWWANPAVAVNNYYQSVFPPDIHAVFDHGKRAVSSFPIATGTYYKMDYSAGVDISNYRNIKVPTSYMGVNSRYDFEGGYENDSQAGMLHVASHHVSPGKKQWTWGNGDFGRAWDRNLTDNDGPYIELMAGVFTENQPDFSWLQPYEEKAFTQYFLPYRELGIVKNANRDYLLNIIPVEKDTVELKIFATSHRQPIIRITDNNGDVIFEQQAEISPEKLFERLITIPELSFDNITLDIVDENRAVLSWHSEPDCIPAIPDPAEAPLPPSEMKTTEQLYLTGLHIEQYRHATYSPLDYYLEALRRDADDVRCNNAIGLWFIRKGRFALALPYLERAIKALTRRNPNPYDGEPLYNLGVALKHLGRLDEAYSRFYKATWNGAWQDAAFFACAQISCSQNRLDDALYEIDRSLLRNWNNGKARMLKCAILRRKGLTSKAVSLAKESLDIDLFNFGCRNELRLCGESDTTGEIMRNDARNYDDTALDYIDAGCYDEAIGLWQLAIKRNATTAMSWYYLGYAFLMNGDNDAAIETFRNASSTNIDYCFPNRLDDISVLDKAIEVNPTDATAHYLLGNLYYDKRQYDIAIINWEQAAQLNSGHPTVWRNLALAYFNKQRNPEKALECMERSFALDQSDSRIFMELDQLYKRLHKPHASRLKLFNENDNLVRQRDDLIIEKATLLNLMGNHKDAILLIDSRSFHPWEGGEGKVSAQYQIARVELAKREIADKRYDNAICLLEQCLTYPHHLGEGKLQGAQENDFYYLLGVCHRALENETKATECFTKATDGPTEPVAAMYYNDAKPDKIFYAGLAFRALGDEDKARSYFNKLVNYGKQHLNQNIVMDFFAVSLPDLLIWDGDLNVTNRLHCLYMLALGYFGLGEMSRGTKYLNELMRLDPNHQGARSINIFIQKLYSLICVSLS